MLSWLVTTPRSNAQRPVDGEKNGPVRAGSDCCTGRALSWSVSKDCSDTAAVLKGFGISDGGTSSAAEDRLDELVHNVVDDVATHVARRVHMTVVVDSCSESEVGFDDEMLDAAILG